MLPARTLSACVASTVAAVLTVSAQSQQPPTFSSANRTVAVYATVTEPSGRLVTDLEKDKFEITDNGKRQDLTIFANDIQPITIVILLDRSGSMRDATARGTYTAADAYPYLAGQTGLAALIIPGWAQDGGRDAMLKRFADPALRARIVKEAEDAMNARFGGPGGVYLPAIKQELTAVMPR